MRFKQFKIIAASEYQRRMRQRSFIISAFGLPFFILAATVISILIITNSYNKSFTIGYVDNGGIVAKPVEKIQGTRANFISFSDEQKAKDAVNSGEVSGVFVIPSDYLASSEITIYHKGGSQETSYDAIRAFLRYQLLYKNDEEMAGRIAKGFDFAVYSLDGRREMSDETWPNLVIPIIAAILFFITILGNAGNALNAVASEKEARTMEILATSASPEEIVGGKIGAIFAIGITQIVIWAIVVILAIFIAAQRVETLRHFRPDWFFLAFIFLLFSLSYMLTAGLLAAIGAMTGEMREGQQLATIITLPSAIPLWLLAAIMNEPNGVIAVVLSLFPLTASLTLSIRWAFSSVPLWQVLLSLLIIGFSAVFAVFIAAQVFKAGMLRYGKRLSWSEVVAAVRGRRSA